MKQGRTDDIPAPANSAGAGSKAIWQRIAAVAVAGLPVLLALGLIFVVPWLLEEPWLGRARTVHAEWTGTDRIAGGRVLDTKNYLTGLRRLGPTPHLPDLTEARFRITRVTYVAPADDRPGGIHVGYTGQENCRISLWISRTGQAGSGPLVSHRGGSSFSWYGDGLRYVLVTTDMRNAHFHLIAKISRQTTLARQGPYGALRAALGLSRIISKPCRK